MAVGGHDLVQLQDVVGLDARPPADGVDALPGVVVGTQDPSVIYYKIDAPEAQRDVYLYHKKNAYLTRAMQEFIRIAVPEA